MELMGFSMLLAAIRGNEEPFCAGGLGASFIASSEGFWEAGMGESTCEGWTCTGSQPPGACVIFASSRPRKRGMEGPVRSISRIPTEWPARERERAS